MRPAGGNQTDPRHLVGFPRNPSIAPVFSPRRAGRCERPIQSQPRARVRPTQGSGAPEWTFRASTEAGCGRVVSKQRPGGRLCSVAQRSVRFGGARGVPGHGQRAEGPPDSRGKQNGAAGEPAVPTAPWSICCYLVSVENSPVLAGDNELGCSVGAVIASAWCFSSVVGCHWEVLRIRCLMLRLRFRFLTVFSLSLQRSWPGSSGCGRRPRCRWPTRNS